MDWLAAVSGWAKLDRPAGGEESVRRALTAQLCSEAVRWQTDPAGNLLLCSGPGEMPVALVAGMDEPGVSVTAYDDDGFGRLGPRGALTPASLVGARLRFADGSHGVIGLEPSDSGESKPTWDRLYLDLGHTRRQAAEAALPLGSAGVLDAEVRVLGSGQLCGRALGTAAALAVIVAALRDARGPWGAVFVAQSQLGGRGIPAAFDRQPAEMLIGVGPAAATDTPKARGAVVRLGGGPVLIVQDRDVVAAPAACMALREAASRAGVALQVASGDPGSHPVGVAARTGLGAAAAILGFPLRYAGTPAEVCAVEDLASTAAVLAALIDDRGQGEARERSSAVR